MCCLRTSTSRGVFSIPLNPHPHTPTHTTPTHANTNSISSQGVGADDFSGEAFFKSLSASGGRSRASAAGGETCVVFYQTRPGVLLCPFRGWMRADGGGGFEGGGGLNGCGSGCLCSGGGEDEEEEEEDSGDECKCGC